MPIKISELAKKLKTNVDEIRFILQIMKMPISGNAETLSDEHEVAVTKYVNGEEEVEAVKAPKKVVEKVEKVVKAKVDEIEKKKDEKKPEEKPSRMGTIIKKASATVSRPTRMHSAHNATAVREAARKRKAEQDEEKILNKTFNKKQDPEKIKQKEEARRIKLEAGVFIPEIISVKEFAEKIDFPTANIIKILIKNGMMVTLNHKIDYDICAIIADELGINIKKEAITHNAKDLLEGNIEKLLVDEDKKNLKKRPAIISVMGHVDHGKTKLLDYIRKTNVVAGEAGGITQSIGAYQTKSSKDELFTFLDTPGHEAFTAMRARGAKATDIAILVVAADEGVKPQTIEAIHHAKDANIPIIVAINKMDKPDAEPDKVKAELSEHGLLAEDWKGDTIMVPLSAITGDGVDILIDMISLVAEMQDLKANPDRMAIGTIIESHLDKSLGNVATILINSGTLRQTDNFLVGESYGRIKTMKDSTGKNIKIATPSTPVQISGLSGSPMIGDILQGVVDEKTAREKANEIGDIRHNARMRGGAGTLAEIMSRIHKGQMKQLKIILKANTLGSLEAVRSAIINIKHPEVMPNIVHSGIGAITESDVLFASAAGAIIIGFTTDATVPAKKMADREGVEIMNFRVIYHLVEKIEQILEGLLDPEIREVELGDLRVMGVFFTAKNKKDMIIGGKIVKGKIENKLSVRIIRGDKEVGIGTIKELKSGEKTVAEMSANSECGMKIEGKDLDIQLDDIIVAWKTEKIIKKL